MTGWRWAVGIVLLLHGIGHLLGLIPLFKAELVSGWNLRSWLLTDAIGEGAAKGVGAVLFAGGLVVFILAGLAVLGWGVPGGWWMPLAVAGAISSTVALVLFWNAFPFLVPNKVGALAVNIIILGNWAGLWHWPSESMLGDQAAQAARTIT
jgi:hypothetical protein